MSGERPAPLADIRVCDVTQNLAGPFCAQILADLGATVIKVEPPGGDLGRLWGPPFWGDDSTLFLSANRGKRSIVLDLKQPEGIRVLRRLATSCDVFIQASRPAAAERLGIDASSVHEWREDIVHLSLSAYGQDGPMSDQPGYDPLMQAYAGMISVTGEPNGGPTRVGGSVVDFGTGMWAALSVLAALRERDRTGTGATLEASLMDTSLAWVSYHMMGFIATGRVPGPMGSSLGAIAPYRAFPTSDGYVMIAAGNDAIFRRLCVALELAGVADDPRFRSNSERVANRAILDSIVEAATECMTTDDLLERTKEHAIPASAIQSIDQVVADPQVDAAGMFPRVEHPDLAGYRDVSLPLRMNGERPRAEEVPPARGQHSVEILQELGLDEGEIKVLSERGVISSSR
ncbi:MAG: CoA transferase [Gemmatimonadota bacterium]|nr:CoA transferase [Gemmatimonadota bacterium]MDE3012778.1 CoA transferase [Gemmatimonadota bacterium]